MATIVNVGTRHFCVNFTPVLSGDELLVVEAFVDTFVAAGWSGVDYSDGAVQAGLVDPPNDMGASNRWFRLRAPTGLGEVIYQRGTSDRSWKAYYSKSGFNGDGGISTLPTPIDATDQMQFVGVTNGFDTLYIHNGGGALTRRWAIMADDQDHDGFYPFYMISQDAGTHQVQRFTAGMNLVGYPDGTVGDADASPYALSEGAQSVVGTGTDWFAHYKKGLAGEALDLLRGTAYLGFPNSAPVNPYTGADDFVPVVLEANIAPEQIKGQLEDVFYPGRSGTNSDTYNLASDPTLNPPGPLRRFGDYLVPWPTGVVPV
mgnify:CR=1 FL=1